MGVKPMASLQGLPPLPKSLSGLLSFSSAQWKELERLHTMRMMIQQDLSRGATERLVPHPAPQDYLDKDPGTDSSSGNQEPDLRVTTRTNRLDAQLAQLRKEMVGLRQLDMSLLCQLWSLNESIQEYKQLLQERMVASPYHGSSSPGWDNGLDSPSSEEPIEINGKSFHLEFSLAKQQGYAPHVDLASVPEGLSLSSSSSHSSLEFGNV